MSNSLASVHPELIPEWSERNLPLTPDKITFGSNKRVWWKGACGHEWETSVKARSKGEKCPICSGARVIEGINDLATLKPLLAQEWSEKNELKPTEVSVASHKKIIWKCKHGHEWEASVKSRTVNGTGCPYCSHNKVLAGFNDLASQYTLVLDTPNETITDRVGIREVHVANNQIYVNGQSIKFHGVNRHESDPVTGYAVGFEQTKKDLLMIKKHNFNAIRTSHYPDVPYFYQLCDQYGFFVIDEADNESHGASEYYCEGNESWPNHVENWNKPIADNPEFTEATVDRTRLCVERDKNRPCVIIWSMGNESAYGCTFEEALAWTKSFDPRRLTHYESAQYRSKNRKYDFSNIDMFSNMYPSLESIQEYLDNEPDKPYIMCEYSHCMGNGPGDLEDYFQFIQSHDGLVGGFLWEWCDHGIYKGKMPDGRGIYYYGGDHNEWPHDGNFCMDGLVYPDRRPHTGLLEFKNVYRPARVVKYDRESGMLTLHNYISLQKFLDLDVCWTVSNSGAVTLALHAERNTVFPELPRFGLRLFLPKEMARVSYFGMGPMESYCDKHHAASHGYFSSTIWQQHEDYIRPQENGSHYDCDYVQLDGAGIKLTAVGAKPFCFNASHYTQEELTEKAHNYELHPCDSTVLCLDYAQNGIGSASCGPRLAEQYRLDDASFDFSIRLIPEKA